MSGFGATAMAAPGALPSSMTDLSSRELRLLIMSLDSRSTSDQIAEALGLSKAAIANAVTRIRRKLRAPSGATLRDAIGDTSRLASTMNLTERRPWFRYGIPRPAGAHAERRQKDLLRRGIADLQLVADRARAYAASLDLVISIVPAEDVFTVTEEAVSLKLLAGDIEELVERVVLRERHWGKPTEYHPSDAAR